MQLDEKQLRMLKPQSVTIYQIPKENPQPPVPYKPEYYRALQMNNTVRQEVIESLGGLADTIKPLEPSLRNHEMRPFDVVPTYREDLIRSKRYLSRKQSPHGEEAADYDETTSELLAKTLHENKPNTHILGSIVSASPYRAIIRKQSVAALARHNEEESKSDEEDEDEYQQDQPEFERDLQFRTGRDDRAFNPYEDRKTKHMFGEIIDEEVLTAQPDQRRNLPSRSDLTKNEVLLSSNRDLDISKMSNNAVTEESMILRHQRNNFLNRFNQHRD